MAASPILPFIAVEEYLATSYPDGDREYLDGLVVERHVGTPGHSALQKILIVHLAALEKSFGLAVRPECRTRIEETRYRVPDVLVMARPFRQTDRVVLDAPWLIIEILSPEDTTRDTLRRFREYEKLGVRYILQMDPEDRTTHQFIGGDLAHRDLISLETPGGGSLPFDTRELLARLDDEPGDVPVEVK
jgi:Uma2 family endonuclease